MTLRQCVPLALLVCLLGLKLGTVRAFYCRDQLLQTVGGGQSFLLDWIDPETPNEACTKSLCTDNSFSVCDPASGAAPKEDLVLVFSDEFNEEGRKFGANDNDTKWTAMNMYYFPTRDMEVYLDEQVTTEGGAAVVTIERRIGEAVSQQPDGKKWEVKKPYVSGFMEGWNKFCYTGGYLEASVKLPGDHFTPGFWPALWTMGNLGRAGYMKSTTGFWPYSYDTCGDGSNGQAWSKNMPQKISACPDADGFDRTQYGMQPGKGRGAPEFDVFEVSVWSTNDGTPDEPGPNYQPPHASHTLQMAPLLPQGVHWNDAAFYQSLGVENGVFYPGQPTKFQTYLNQWWGALSTEGQEPRPGNQFQDSISAVSLLDSSFYTSYHKFGVDWKPGEYLRWYIDDQFVYEVNKNALLPRVNGSGASVGQRLIPLEPVYIIFNLGMSEDFGRVDKDNLEFPSKMLIDWIRVYQRRDAVNVGCSPPDFPTAEYIAANRDTYYNAAPAGMWRHCGVMAAALAAAALALLGLL